MNYLTLTRKTHNKSYTIGVLTASWDTDFALFTKEWKLPEDRKSYIKALLPPNEYDAPIEHCALDYKGNIVHGYWPELTVQWFPNAGLVTYNKSPRFGRIVVGAYKADDFNLDGFEEATKAMLRLFKKLYEQEGDRELKLRIVQNESEMGYLDMSEHEFNSQKLAEEERKREAYLLDEIYGEE